MTVTIRQVTRWIVLCVAGVVLCDVPGPDRPDITLLSTENLQTCVAASNTNGYGLTFMSATLSETEHEVFVCEFQSRHFGCSFEFQVMRIDYALYGRNSRENCPSPGHDQNTQCTSSGAIEIVRSRCEGRRYCTVSADNRLFGDPCSGVLKFLQVQYTCVLVPEFKYTDGSGAIKDVSSDCDFEDTSGCWRNWHHTGISLQTSGLFPLSPVTDERWNSFEVYRTVGQSIKPNYKKKYDIQENFFIGFSVRSTENAQILLCSTQYPASSPCYWIIIDGYPSTGIRKCIQGVPDRWAKTLDCKMFRDNITIPEKLLNESMWTHFMVSREDSNRIRLWIWDLSTGLRPLLDYTDDHPLPLSYMFLRSYNAIADWKVHKYKYITIPNTKSSVRLGPPLKFKHLSPICVSLYATICSQCKLDIKLEREDGTIQMESSIEGDSDGPFMKWRNVRLQGGISTSSSTHYQLYLALNTRNGTDDNTFWAIDDFRTCLHNEIRVAQAFSYTTLLCQSLKHPGWIFNRLNKVENDHEPPICPDGRYIGQHCNISFSSVIPKSGYTENQKICMPTQKENSKGSCTCVAGYTWVSGCVNQCSSGYYGYDCKNKCGMCKNNYNCNRITGICPAGCKDRYLPPYCQIICPRLRSPPAIVEVLYTSVTVQFNDIRIDGSENMVQVVHLECQKLHGSWINCSKPLKLDFGQNVSITGLEKETFYLIRAIVYTNTGYAYRNEDVPTVEVTTSCKIDREIYISENSRNATISFETTSDSCLLKRYKIELQQNGKQIKPQQTVWQNMILLDLMPYMDYQIVLTNTRYLSYTAKTSFKTKQNAPAEINNLHILETTATTVALSWSEPEEKNGIIQKYNIIYKLIQRIDCNNKSISQNGSLFVLPSNTSISNVTITGLLPYSTYFITVAAETILPGKPTGLHCNTTMTNDISEEELPKYIFTSDLSAWSVTIQWSMNCFNLGGPLFFHIVIKCVEEDWCNQIPDITLDNVTRLNVGSTTNDLTPFTHYSVELRAKRSQSGDLTTFSRFTNLSTPAANPPSVRNSTSYSKNNTSVSLRWLYPYPPHGHLEKYTIKYCHSSYICKSVEITSAQLAPCNLWYEHFNCYTLAELYPNHWYTITITAKNKESKLWSPEASTTILTTEDKPSPPLNLREEWKNNVINLSWNHPNITNGLLRKFIIICNETETEMVSQDGELFYKYIHTISEERKVYDYQIMKTYRHSSTYILTVCGVNSYYGENATLYINTMPPTPEFSEDIVVDTQLTTDSTVTVIIPSVKKESKSKTSFLYVVVSKVHTFSKSNFDKENGLKGEILKHSSYEHAWIAKEFIGLNENKFKLLIGSEENTDSQQLNDKIINYKLKVSTAYEISLVLVNRYKNKYSTKVYQKIIWTASNYRPELFTLLLLLLLPLVFYFLYRFIKKGNVQNIHTSNEPERSSAKNTYFEMTENKSNKRTFDCQDGNSEEEHIYESLQNPVS